MNYPFLDYPSTQLWKVQSCSIVFLKISIKIPPDIQRLNYSYSRIRRYSVGVPLPTFLLTTWVRSSTISTSNISLFIGSEFKVSAISFSASGNNLSSAEFSALFKTLPPSSLLPDKSLYTEFSYPSVSEFSS